MKEKVLLGFYILVICLLTFGYGRCIYKLWNCNWSPIGKAEVIYTAGAVTGFGAVVGYFNIEDK